MKLPNYEHAIVPEAKVREYLLSHTHHKGRSKAEFFTRFGFSSDSWHVLAEALVAHASECDVVGVEETPFGTRYSVEGPIPAPDGRNPVIRSIWFFETGETRARFVTAYPIVRK